MSKVYVMKEKTDGGFVCRIILLTNSNLVQWITKGKI
jgi:hypothetical protein